MLNAVILASGNGSNFEAIAQQADAINLSIKALIVNEKDAFALKRAEKYNIPGIVIEHRSFTDRKAFDQALDNTIRQQQPVDYIILAGFMRILTTDFVRTYHHKIINIHPSLLPRHKGLNTHHKAIMAKDTYHGSTIHFVSNKLDGGPIILQTKVRVEPEDDVISLTNKVQRKEHKYYPLVIAWLAQRRIILKTNQIYFDGKPLPEEGIQVD